MTISITNIQFHDGENTAVFNMPSHGYKLSQGHVSVSVDFRVSERDGRYVVLTEVLTALPRESYDALVKRAFYQVCQRLADFGKLAEKIQASFATEQQPA
jgi:hypothetical protein